MFEVVIGEALRHRRLLRFWYKDHQTPTTVEPYTFGQNEAGHDALSAWLVSGETKDTTPPLWRLYLLSEMHRVEMLKDEFRQNRQGYNPNDRRFRVIRCRVGPPPAA